MGKKNVRISSEGRSWFTGCCCGCVSAFAAIALIIGSIAFFAFFVEPKRIEVTDQYVGLKKYPAGAPVLRVVEMADFHRGPYISEKSIARAVKIANRQEPDVVVLAGDFVSRDSKYAESCARALSGLKAKKGIYAVLGNHDYWEGAEEVKSQLESAGVMMLTNRNVEIMKGIRLAGVDDVWAGRPDAGKTLKGVRGTDALIVVCHSPRVLHKLPKDREMLVVTAHTHAGQVDIPGIPRNRLPGLMGWEYIRGWYQEGEARMYVNRGIGMVTPPVRFRARPEITLFRVGPMEEKKEMER